MSETNNIIWKTHWDIMMAWLETALANLEFIYLWYDKR